MKIFTILAVLLSFLLIGCGDEVCDTSVEDATCDDDDSAANDDDSADDDDSAE
jgi:hypothetical protein